VVFFPQGIVRRGFVCGGLIRGDEKFSEGVKPRTLVTLKLGTNRNITIYGEGLLLSQPLTSYAKV